MKRWLLAIVIAAALVVPAAAQKTEIPGLTHYVLDNGLELFVLENHSAPLAYIEIAVRAGAYAQTAETAGLFHLYEHMMFKGNSKYKTASEIQTAIADLGVPSWNGSTGAEHVNYYFTIPSSGLKEGLEFWAYAVRDPLLDPAELEREKGVVLSEITGGYSDPGHILGAGTDRYLFPKFPWRRDPSGSADVIKKSSVADLVKMKDTFYVPNNAALFVGGDVDPAEVYALVKEVYGPWKKAGDPWAKGQEPQAFPAVAKPTYVVYPDPTMSQRYGVFQMYYRGPDVVREPVPTYAADIWGFLIENPGATFKQNISGNPDFSIPNPNYMGGYYYTQRDGGQVVFYSYMMTSAIPFATKAQQLKEAIRAEEVTAMVKDPAYFPKEEYDLVKQLLEDKSIVDLETVDGFLGNLRFWWCSASTDYYFNYVANMKKVGPSDIAAFLDKYILKNLEVIVVRVNPAVYEKEKKAFQDAGFKVITADNAFWWQK